MAKEKIEDFGEKIEGAKKDLQVAKKRGGLVLEDIAEWSEEAKDKLINKDNVFPKPNYSKLLAEGRDRTVVYYIKTIRDAISKEPEVLLDREEARKLREYDHQVMMLGFRLERMERRNEVDNDEYRELKAHYDELRDSYHELYRKGIQLGQIDYVANISALQQQLLQVKTIAEMQKFSKDIEPLMQSAACVTAKVRSAVYTPNSSYGMANLLYDIQKKQFLYSEDEKALTNYVIVPVDKIIFPQEEERQDCLIITINGNSYHYGNNEYYTNPDNHKENTYCVFLANHKEMIGNNFATRQEAEQFAIENYKAFQKEQPEQKTERKKKVNFNPPQLTHICRNGEDYREGENVTGEHILETFKIRGGQFGNWENQNDRQTNLNMCYDAMKDLAKAMQIQDEDISLGGNLGIAFGARGSGNALAHYEPFENVINLTKMKGAGALAHEWGHALDKYIAEKLKEEGLRRSFDYASEVWKMEDNPLHDVMRAILYRPDGTSTKFLEDAKQMDEIYTKSGNQGGNYWSSNVELLARAFECFINDTIAQQGGRCDYLTFHTGEDVGETTFRYAYPTGEERKRINEAFQTMIEQLKEKEIFHERTESKPFKKIEVDIQLEETPEKKPRKPRKSKKEEIQEQQSLIAETAELETEQEETAPATEPTQEIQDDIKALLKQVVVELTLADTAKELKVGDVIQMSPSQMLNRQLQPVDIDKQFAKVKEVTDHRISFDLYDGLQELVHQASSGTYTVESTEEKHWSKTLAEDGFLKVSQQELQKLQPTATVTEEFYPFEKTLADFSEQDIAFCQTVELLMVQYQDQLHNAPKSEKNQKVYESALKVGKEMIEDNDYYVTQFQDYNKLVHPETSVLSSDLEIASYALSLADTELGLLKPFNLETPTLVLPENLPTYTDKELKRMDKAYQKLIQQRVIYDENEEISQLSLIPEVTVHTNVTPAFFKMCQPYLQGEYGVDMKHSTVTLYAEDFDACNHDLERAERVLHEVMKMKESGFSAEQIMQVQDMIYASVELHCDTLPRQSITPQMTESQIQDIRTLIYNHLLDAVKVEQSTLANPEEFQELVKQSDTSFRAIATLKNHYQKMERNDLVEIPNKVLEEFLTNVRTALQENPSDYNWAKIRNELDNAELNIEPENSPLYQAVQRLENGDTLQPFEVLPAQVEVTELLQKIQEKEITHS